MKILISGHRPTKLGGYDFNNPIRITIFNSMISVLKEYQKTNEEILGISGMALGIDQDFCKACIELNINYHAYIPFIGQENIWPVAAKDEYYNLVDKSAKKLVISKGGYAPQKMLARNRKMADDCDLGIIVWDEFSKGGTYSCMQYMKKINKPIIRINLDGDIKK